MTARSFKFYEQLPFDHGKPVVYVAELDRYAYANCTECVTFAYSYYYITKECYQRILKAGAETNASPEEEEILLLAAADMPRVQAFCPGVWPKLDEPKLASWLYCKEDERFYYHVFHNGRHYAIAPGYRMGNEVTDLVRTVIDGKEVVLGRGFEVEHFEGEEQWKQWFDGKK